MRVTLNGIVSADEDKWIYEWFGYSAFSPSRYGTPLPVIRRGRSWCWRSTAPAARFLPQ